MTKKTPNPIDVDVGRRIQIERTNRGMSQSKLGKRIGVSCQQIQKYEKGMNRISPSRLSGIADALGMPVAAFFGAAGATDATPTIAESSALDWLTVKGALRLLRAYSEIPEGPLRRAIVDLAEGLAKSQSKKHT